MRWEQRKQTEASKKPAARLDFETSIVKSELRNRGQKKYKNTDSQYKN